MGKYCHTSTLFTSCSPMQYSHTMISCTVPFKQVSSILSWTSDARVGVRMSPPCSENLYTLFWTPLTFYWPQTCWDPTSVLCANLYSRWDQVNFTTVQVARCLGWKLYSTLPTPVGTTLQSHRYSTHRCFLDCDLQLILRDQLGQGDVFTLLLMSLMPT